MSTSGIPLQGLQRNGTCREEKNFVGRTEASFLSKQDLTAVEGNPRFHTSWASSSTRSASPLSSWATSPSLLNQYLDHREPSVNTSSESFPGQSMMEDVSQVATPDTQRSSSMIDFSLAQACSTRPPSNATSARSTTPLEERTLYDILDGKLFEDADPWNTIKERLGIYAQNSAAPTNKVSDNSDLLALRSASDRRGVGYYDDTANIRWQFCDSNRNDLHCTTSLERPDDSTQDFMSPLTGSPPLGVRGQDGLTSNQTNVTSHVDSRLPDPPEGPQETTMYHERSVMLPTSRDVSIDKEICPAYDPGCAQLDNARSSPTLFSGAGIPIITQRLSMDASSSSQGVRAARECEPGPA